MSNFLSLWNSYVDFHLLLSTIITKVSTLIALLFK